jgi:glyoxylase-like metal-dependent hydrolase (beta-lactamase superfamily II)
LRLRDTEFFRSSASACRSPVSATRTGGRGNTNGDAIAWLPRERIVIAGDLLVRPVLFVDDGYPSDWIHTLDRLEQLDAATIVPGHGHAMRDWAYLRAIRELFRSAVGQVTHVLR